MNNPDTPSVTQLSRTAGFWYLALAVFGAFGILVADNLFLVPGDAAATAKLIQADTLLFRLGIASNLIGQVCYLFVGLSFYRLFQTVNKGLAQSLLVMVVAAVPIAFLNAVFKFAALELLSGAPYLAAWDSSQVQSLMLFFLKLQDYGVIIASVYWGLWLVPLGLLTWQSGFLPRVFGVLLVINGLAYVTDVTLAAVFPSARAAFTPWMKVLGIIGEIPFLLWILIRGARIKTSA